MREGEKQRERNEVELEGREREREERKLERREKRREEKRGDREKRREKRESEERDRRDILYNKIKKKQVGYIFIFAQIHRMALPNFKKKDESSEPLLEHGKVG